MLFAHIYPDGHHPSNPGPNTVIAISAPDLKALYVTLRGIPYAHIETFAPAGGTYETEFQLPEDEKALVARLLAHSDEAHK